MVDDQSIDADSEDAFALEQLVAAVENQISDGHPREAGLVLMALLGNGADREQALALMAEVLAEHVAKSMEDDSPFDIDRYAQGLLALAK